VPFKAEHLAGMKVQGAQQALREYVTEDVMRGLEAFESYTALRGEEAVMCGGFIEHWPGRVEMWAYLSGDIGKDFIAVHKKVQRFIRCCTANRIEAVVDCSFSQGHRWLRMLGFRLEAPRMKMYSIDGRDHALYAIVRGQRG